MAPNASLTVAGAFRRVVHWRGDSEAVVDSATRLSFRQLDDLSDRCATLFQELGAEPGKPLAVLLMPSSIYLVAWLGAIKMGALPMALHTRESAGVLTAICNRFAVTTLVYDASMEALAEQIAAGATQIRSAVRATSSLPPQPSPAAKPFATIPDDLHRYAPLPPRPPVAEDDPAVIVLSSGTTSVPKGIVHTHRSLLELARSDVYLYGGLRPTDRTLVPLSPAFIGCYNGWYPFLNAGACIVFMERFELETLISRMTSERITHVFLTPTLWRRLLNADLSSADFSAVRQVGFGAEIMDAETLSRLRERVSANVVQVYGSTETGAGGTCIFADEMVGDRLVSVGRPLLNGDMRIVTPGGAPSDEVPVGEVGEILLTSPSLAREVWNDEAMTRSLFLDDGVQRWWRSRDLGHVDADGYLYVAGRNSDMIISGGINIMPGAVEAVLLTHPLVAECAVVGAPHLEWGEQVHAFVVASDASLSALDLELHMSTSDLSQYQRPRAYSFVSELPRTPTNKVVRSALRDLAAAQGKAKLK